MTAPPLTASTSLADRLEGRGAYPRWVLWVALTGLFATTFPITVLTVAIPSIADDFGVTESSLAWLITLPTVCSALALPVLGKLGDLYGHRRTFLIGFALCTVTTALTATANTPAALIAWRTVTQVIGGATQPSSLALINSVYEPATRAKAMGWWASTAAGAPVVGLVIGGPLVESVGWQMVFVLQAVCMVLPVAASWFVLRETERREARFDVPGAVTLSLGVGALMLLLSSTGSFAVPAAGVVAAAVLGPLMLVAFVLVERRAAAPLLPLEFFRIRDFSATIVTSFLSSAAYMGGYFLATLMILKEFGFTETGSVGILLIRPLAFAVSSPIGGWFTGRVGTRLATVSGCVALAGGMGSLAVGAQLESLAIVIAGGFVLQGLGYGLLRPPVTTAVANALPQRDLGIGAASERLMGQIGVAFGITLLTVVYADTPTPGRFAAGFAVGAVLALLAAVAALAMHRLPGGRAGRGARTGGSTARTVDELAAEEAGAAVPAGAGEPVGGTGVAAGGAGGSAGGSTVGSVTLGEQGGPMGPSGSPPVP